MMPGMMAAVRAMMTIRMMPARAMTMHARVHIDLAAAVILAIRRVIGLLVHTEHALDAADDATDRAADDRADRTRNAAAFIESMGNATRHALGLRRDRSRQRREQCARKHKSKIHCTTLHELGRRCALAA